MSAITAERLSFFLTNEGRPGVAREVRKLVVSGIIRAGTAN